MGYHHVFLFFLGSTFNVFIIFYFMVKNYVKYIFFLRIQLISLKFIIKNSNINTREGPAKLIISPVILFLCSKKK